VQDSRNSHAQTRMRRTTSASTTSLLSPATCPKPIATASSPPSDKKPYPQGEISERIRQALRDLGHFKAQIDDSDISFTPQSERRTVDVTVKVEPGAQYRLGEISFQNARIFSANQLRNAFPMPVRNVGRQ
jgi:outer membrane translocation and assembly module TamA